MILDQLIQSDPDDATVAALWPDQPENYQPVPAISVAQWLGEAGLRERLDMFLAMPLPAQDHPMYAPTIGLRAGVKQLLSMQANPAAELIVAPGTGNRALLDGGVASGVLTADDAARLITRARPVGYVEHTAETVAARRAAMAAEAQQAERQNAFDVIDNVWGVEIYGVGRAELMRRRDAGEALPAVDELLAFVTDGRKA